MLTYEFVNPSDPYTFTAKDRETAALAVMLLGLQYGARTEDGNDELRVPILMLDDSPDAWFKDMFGREPNKALKVLQNDVADALESFVFGDFSDRKGFEAALRAIDDPEKKATFVKEWQSRISSLNDIGTYAHNAGKSLREMVL